jgi:SAM-dependent methyltransferase
MENRFRFGENWNAFLSTLSEERIQVAENHLTTMLGIDSLTGKSFLDIGCGSGLFSLAAMRLGAERVHSFDYDPVSVQCATSLRAHFFENSQSWTIEQGDVLDRDYVKSLRQFDVVYSWGVLHHTGQMWKALENASLPASSQGARLFVAIYNDQGGASRRWRTVKRFYNLLPGWARMPYVILFIPYLEYRTCIRNLLAGREPWIHWTEYKKNRGMSKWYDCVDWIGGYPFEVAKPEEIFEFYKARGFKLEKSTTCGRGSGNCEYVFTNDNHQS